MNYRGEVEEITADVVVVGSEAAGARAAIECQAQGLKPLVLTKGLMARSGVTIMAVATYSAPFQEGDDPEVFFQDTIRGGVYVNNQRLARIFTEEARQTVLDLVSYGAPFAKRDNNFFQLQMPGHSFPRGCFTEPIGTTGRKLTQTLRREVLRRGIPLREDTMVFDLLWADGDVAGVAALDMRDGRVLLIRACAVILATGGGMRVYAANCAAREATGDGLALAYRAGAELQDMEFVQFFPTVMVWPPKLYGHQTATRLRYELNAQLLNFYGERFMKRYDAERMEKSTRDIVARGIFREILAGRGTEHGGVYLDVSYLPRKVVENYLAKFYPGHDFGGVNLLAEGIDVREEPIEVAPAVHFFMGGIRIDEHGQTGVPGLYACGEVCGGVHGANRLGGSALPEMLVFGRRAGAAASERVRKMGRPADVSAAQREVPVARVEAILARKPGSSPAHAVRELQKTMWQGAFVVRDERGLRRALEQIEDLRNRQDEIVPSTRTLRYNRELMEALELDMMLDVSEMIVRSALERTESRGAHYRADYPERDDARWLKNVVLKKGPQGVTIRTEPVDLCFVQPSGAAEEAALDEE